MQTPFVAHMRLRCWTFVTTTGTPTSREASPRTTGKGPLAHGSRQMLELEACL